MALNKPDEMIHEPVRHEILCELLRRGPLSFVQLREILGTTDGNLSVAASKLEKAGYLTCEKGFHGRRPLTTYSLSASGRYALLRYCGRLLERLGRVATLLMR